MKQIVFKYNGNGFLAWGYSVVLFSALIYACLIFTGNDLFYLLYLGVPISANVIVRLKNKSNTASTTEKLIDNIWSLFGLIAVLSCIGRYFYEYPLFALISLLMGIETIITGVILKRKVIVICGFVGVLGTVPLVLINGYNQLVIISIIFLFISAIPGHILNRKPVLINP
ncbi:hypothetical protein OCV73_13900 [Barnesiella propionica]|uniref:hypothetical protein n=1 Tax=Barnesiella propionica TaxID=2981781 RepID=UPI0011C7E9A7|nr:hypothetical protein [Barnesiella propionica]MCU6770030.1 hypothetical protein [Barnesiella propionica]